VQTFGLDLYHFCNYYLAELEARAGGAIRLVRSTPSCARLRSGETR